MRNDKIKWSYSTFNKEKKKLDMTVPDNHVLKKEYVLKDLASKQSSDYIGWIGHATFLKLFLVKYLPSLRGTITLASL